MPDVRVARPLLENTSMTDNNTPATGIEPMIDAKQAAAALRPSSRAIEPPAGPVPWMKATMPRRPPSRQA